MRINSHFALYDTIKNDKIQGKSPDWHFMDDLRVTAHGANRNNLPLIR